MPYSLAVAVSGLVATAVAVVMLRRLGVVDVPNHRSSHSQPTVRGAGIGVAICGITAAAIAAGEGAQELWALAAVTAAFTLVGMLDDLHPLGVGIRLPAQFVLAVLAIALLRPPGGWFVWSVGLVFVVGYVNAFNFMDGINGISGLHAIAIGVSWTIAGGMADEPLAVFLGGVVAAAALAFLPFNIPRARAFLGDVGSYFFGSWIAVSVVLLVGRLPLVVLVLPVLPYVADTAWTLVRRIRRGDTWHEAHREHVYQRVVQTGWSHVRTSATMGSLTLLCGALGIVAIGASTNLAAMAVAGAVAACIGYLALPRILTDQRVADA